MKKLLYRLFQVILILQVSCITPLTDVVSEEDLVLVVEGFITDEPGPHDVQVTFFNPIDPNRRSTNAFPNVQVSVIEVETQESTLLRRSTVTRKFYDPPDDLPPSPPECSIEPSFMDGQTPFQTPASFRGVVGNSYILEVRFGGDKVYRSEPQLMLPTPDIDSLLLDFVEIPTVERDRPGSGVEVYASWQDPPEANYYFWQLQGTYRIDTRFVPTPTEVSNADCFCFFDIADDGLDGCWIVEPDLPDNEEAFSDIDVNGNEITLPIGIVVDDGVRFREGKDVDPQRLYHIEVAQYAMSEEAFLYKQRIEILKEIDGEIFDPAPLGIEGNLKNIEDDEELIIGFFGAYSVKKKGIFIEREMLDFIQIPSTQICGDCRVRDGSQLQTPDPFL